MPVFSHSLDPTSPLPFRHADGRFGASSPIRRIVSHRLQSAEGSPLRATSSRPNNARVSAQVMLPTGSQTADVTLPKNPLTAGAERSQPAFINKREGTCGQTARLKQEGRRAWQF